MNISNVWKGIILLTVMAATAADPDEVIHQSFEQLGQLAVGVSYGHLHAWVKTSMLREQVEEQALTVRRLMNAGLVAIQKWEGEAQDDKALLAEAKLTSIRYEGWMWSVRTRLNEIVKPTRDVVNLVEDPAHHVTKRQVLGVAAVTEATAAFAFAMYNNKRIGNLELAVDQNAETLARVVRTSERLFNHTREDISMLVNRTKLMDRAVTRVTLAEATLAFTVDIDFHVSQLEIRAEKWRRGLISLLQGYVTPELIVPGELRKQLGALEIMAKKKGMKMLHLMETDIYRFEVSFIKKPNGVRIFIHVPITRGDVLDVYKHVPIDHLDSEKGVVYSIETEKDVLALNQATGKSMALSLAELNRCRRVGQLYYCDHQRVLDRDQSNSCVGAMFAGIKDSVLSRCTIRVKLLEDVVQPVNHTTFRIISTKDTVRVYRECQDSYSSVSSGSEITLEPGCAAQTQDHWFAATADVESAREMIITPVLVSSQIPPLNLSGSVLKSLKDTGEVKLTAADIKRMSELEKGVVRVGEPTMVWFWIFLVAIFTIVIGASVLVWKKIRASRKGQESAKDNSVAMQRWNRKRSVSADGAKDEVREPFDDKLSLQDYPRKSTGE